MMKKVVVLLAGLMMLASCEFQQDPLTGAPDRVKNGQKPVEKPEPAKAIDPNLLVIDGPATTVNGRVNIPVEFKISGRVLESDVPFQIVITNLADFPGATYDAQTGDFKWTPGRDKVAGYPSADLKLNVAMYSGVTDKYQKISAKEQSFLIFIQNEYTKPIINQVQNVSSYYITGTDAYLDVTLEDVDALTIADLSFGVQECSSWSTKSLSHLVQIESLARVGTTTKFTGKLHLRLGDVDNLPTGSYCFNFNFTSKFGMKSDNTLVNVNLEAKLRDTLATQSEVNIFAGQMGQYSFSIFEPNHNGELSLTTTQDEITQMAPGSTVTCTPSTYTKSQINCLLSVDATTETVGIRELKLKVTNTAPRSKQSVTTEHKIKINVKAVAP